MTSPAVLREAQARCTSDHTGRRGDNRCWACDGEYGVDLDRDGHCEVTRLVAAVEAVLDLCERRDPGIWTEKDTLNVHDVLAALGAALLPQPAALCWNCGHPESNDIHVGSPVGAAGVAPTPAESEAGRLLREHAEWHGTSPVRGCDWCPPAPQPVAHQFSDGYRNGICSRIYHAGGDLYPECRLPREHPVHTETSEEDR